MGHSIQPRFIRMRDAPNYLGMSKDEFVKTVRPLIKEFSIGQRGIAFDRLDLDAWADEYKRRNGRPKLNGGSRWDVQERGVSSSKMMGQGPLTKSTKESESMHALGMSPNGKLSGGLKTQSHIGDKGKLNNLQFAMNMCSQMVQRNT